MCSRNGQSRLCQIPGLGLDVDLIKGVGRESRYTYFVSFVLFITSTAVNKINMIVLKCNFGGMWSSFRKIAAKETKACISEILLLLESSACFRRIVGFKIDWVINSLHLYDGRQPEVYVDCCHFQFESSFPILLQFL